MASVLGTAWLTAYRALFTKSGLRAGETVLIQGATGGMATALIQLGRAAGFEVWATSRGPDGQLRAEALGAHRTFPANEQLPRKVPAVIDNVGSESWAHSMASVARGETLVTLGGTTGFDVPLNLLQVIANQLIIAGSIMGTRRDMEDLMPSDAAPDRRAAPYGSPVRRLTRNFKSPHSLRESSGRS